MILRTLAFASFLFCSCQCLGQYTLTTPDGKRVQLNQNGTWKFISSDSLKPGKLNIPAGSKAKYTSNFKKFEIWYNPGEWVVDTVKKAGGYTWDAYFYSTDYAIQGYCLDSRLAMPIENIESGIREQWQQAGEIKLFKSNKDTVNNLPVTVYEMEFLENNITYAYKGIVYSGKGSFQITVGTQKEIFVEDKDKIDLLLKGIVKK